MSHDVLNLNNSASTGAQGHSDSPHNHSKHGLNTPTSIQTPNNMLATTSTSLLNSVLNNSTQKSAVAANVAKLNSSNNLLSGSASVNAACDNYDSPTLMSSNTHVNTTNHRLSTNRNNMSHNNLSTSASLLDATADDAMSSKRLLTLIGFFDRNTIS